MALARGPDGSDEARQIFACRRVIAGASLCAIDHVTAAAWRTTTSQQTADVRMDVDSEVARRQHDTSISRQTAGLLPRQVGLLGLLERLELKEISSLVFGLEGSRV